MVSEYISLQVRIILHVRMYCMCVCCITADEEFDELCFDFGIELDEVVSLLCVCVCGCGCVCVCLWVWVSAYSRELFC